MLVCGRRIRPCMLTFNSETAFMTVLLMPKLSPLSKIPRARVSGRPIGLDCPRLCALLLLPGSDREEPSVNDWRPSSTLLRRRTGGRSGGGTSVVMPRRFLFSCMTETPIVGVGDICRVRA